MALCGVENCKSWDKSGKQDFIRQCRNLIGKTPHMIRDVASKDIKRALYELCWCGLHGNLKLQQVTAALSEILDLHQELPSLLGDVLGILDVEVVCVDDADVRDRFMNFVPLCTGLVSDELLKERLDQETLENIGIFQSRLAFQQKYVKTKTKLYYKQQKFNLVREESEGYSKLITELNQDLRCISPQQILQHIMGLVGCFNLDPNRVLDVILESFERRPEEETFFVKLIQIYMCDHDTLCNTLGFKFHFYQETADLLTPASLYKLAALLLKHQLISLDAIYPHLPRNQVVRWSRASQRKRPSGVSYYNKIFGDMTCGSLGGTSASGFRLKRHSLYARTLRTFREALSQSSPKTYLPI